MKKTSKKDIRLAKIECREFAKLHWQGPTPETGVELKRLYAKLKMLKESFKHSQ